jgi:two-component system cell cycle sensor histidine kinase/response regulator CckA
MDKKPTYEELEQRVKELEKETTNRKMSEQELRATHDYTVAGCIAHDVNNLLMAVQGNVSLMLCDIDSTHPHYEGVKKIETQIKSGAKLAMQLLGYARKGKYEVNPINLNKLVEETSETFERTRDEITIYRELAPDLLGMEANQGQIEQVLLNLYVNAADAMRLGGNLILRTRNVTHRDMRGKLYNPKSGDYVSLTVTDTGEGMDQETLQRIFDPFFTTKEKGRGTGLGLASVYGIIKGHGGYIDVESEKGNGTTFSIYLPATDREVEKVPEWPQEAICGSGTILLVDDEAVALGVGGKLLKRLGYTVFEAKSGREAVETFQANRDNIDLVILDMVMPDMGGGEAYDRMKEINADIKVLLSSGYSIEGEATEILERGCNGFIQKPFNLNELSQKIRVILDKKYQASVRR